MLSIRNGTWSREGMGNFYEGDKYGRIWMQDTKGIGGLHKQRDT